MNEIAKLGDGIGEFQFAQIGRGPRGQQPVGTARLLLQEIGSGAAEAHELREQCLTHGRGGIIDQIDQGLPLGFRERECFHGRNGKANRRS